MEKYSLSQQLTAANNPNGQRRRVCHCSEGHTSHHQQVTSSDLPDYFYKKLPVSRGKAFKDLRRRESQRGTEDNRQQASINVKSKDATKSKDSDEVEVQAVKRSEPQVGREGRIGVLRRGRQTEIDEEEEERRRVSLRRVARVANCHHLPRVATKPRSLSATSSSSSSSLQSASRRSQTQQRASSVTKILQSPSIRSFSSSSHLQYSGSCQPTSHLNHTSNLKFALSTSNLLQSPPSSPQLSLSPPPRLSSSTSSVLEFSSSLSSLEGSNQPEERNRDVSVYLQVPRTILVSRRRIVEDGKFHFKFNSSPFLLREAWAG